MWRGQGEQASRWRGRPRFQQSGARLCKTAAGARVVAVGVSWWIRVLVTKEGEGGAVQSIKEREDKEEQLQEAETAELRKAAKLYREKIQQDKRFAREVAKEAKERERAEKAAQRGA
ncbi:uncharacterized protein CC84DRAFT_1170159 [Paraphaeosphaeria sporulosa]|uniref:Uncharacterized protein n=1 Tax=Paraphaeosphaeria sporulosa TaxID=1460663 RepID=A0A177CW07_9PLEO|nr:uncharacterized protein CC84DRAFT_1170159 [Paraphaeosphaeria sporulosa]OAG11218.1 hypothetical protein CC84DRAFT_1170159 [Paraphaeosphaeria sporulosa]